jgi:hypothetical protein
VFEGLFALYFIGSVAVSAIAFVMFVIGMCSIDDPDAIGLVRCTMIILLFFVPLALLLRHVGTEMEHPMLGSPSEVIDE